ncbi:MAG: alcohol dehydrogenase [Chloroflexi bacterium]|nr:alcohol dehydrogenase [Chloroflexota bacterium]
MKLAAGPGHLELCDIPEPHPGPGQVSLEIRAVGICGTDLHIRDGEYPCRPPVILGHEFCGTIHELGDDVTGWAIGDRVTSITTAMYCGACRYCRAGQPALCASRLSYGGGVHGAFAPRMIVQASGLYHLPARQDFIAACLTEPLACVTKAVFEVGQLQAGERVAILGPGAIGLLTLQVARAAGARVTLIGLRSDAARLNLGQTLGADAILYAEDPDLPDQLNATLGVSEPGAPGADVVFECSGAGAAFGLALRLARKQGRIIQVGLFGKPVPSDLDLIVLRDLTVRGSFASSPTSWERALRLTGSGQVDTRSLVSDVFPLQDWEQAFARAASRSGLKIVVQPVPSN